METTQPTVLALKPVRRAASSSEVSSDVPMPTMGKLGAALFKSQQSQEPGSTTTSSGTPRVGGGLAALLRKKSLRTSVTAMINMRRMSKVGKGPSSATSTQPRPVIMENTYKMVPDDKAQFSSSDVTKIAESILSMELNGVKYDPAITKGLAGELSTMIKERVKRMGFPRYKIVCQVIIGERRDQGLEVATRCLWSTDTDDWACAKFTNDSLFAVAMIHGAYFE